MYLCIMAFFLLFPLCVLVIGALKELVGRMHLEAKAQELLVRCTENSGLGTSPGALKPKAKGFLKTGSEGNWGEGLS